ncbi:hypothetical protein AB0O07_29340 [Streptomyces sp. NPDC093085]|uniref:hypothetical protein n=1 Tax=Streptomyces sp. NPDC093085 TaxID=3155068 RepID=UPI00342FDA42
MLISDVPDLAHTRPRPVHWVATATAMAGVVALAGLLQPGAATASQTGPKPLREASGGTGGAPLPAPDPAAAAFPLECGPIGTVVTQHAQGDLDGDGNPETVAVVRCDAGSGTPPSGVYVLTRTEKGEPRVVATLVDPRDKLTVAPGLAVQDRMIRATLFGYSSPSVPSCCPDEESDVVWQWKNGAFLRTDLPGAAGTGTSGS